MNVVTNVAGSKHNIPQGDKTVTWKGLNDLPYGVYTLELSQGDDEMKMRLIKRV